MFIPHLLRTAANNAGTLCAAKLPLERGLTWVTLVLGGRVGARLTRRPGLLAGGSTLLRDLRKRARPPSSTEPRVIGIDEWAWKKGHRYGTILCDLERLVIDLLPNRSTETVAAWRRQHANVQVASRDRGEFLRRCLSQGCAGSGTGSRPLPHCNPRYNALPIEKRIDAAAVLN